MLLGPAQHSTRDGPRTESPHLETAMQTAFSMLLASGLVVLLAGLARAEELWPMPDWPTATPEEEGMAVTVQAAGAD